MMRWCLKEPPEKGWERKIFKDKFYEAICKLPYSWLGNNTQLNPPHPKPFKREFLLEHGFQSLPSARSIPTLIGLFLFSIGASFFFIWDLYLMMGWSTFEWPLLMISLLVLGVLMSGRQLVKYAGDLSVDSYGMFDIWMTVLFVSYSLGFAEILQTDKQKTIDEWSFWCQGAGSVGGLISIILSAVMFIPSFLWTLYNGWQFYKALNAIIYKNTYDT